MSPFLQTIIDRAKSSKQTIVLPEGSDVRTLQAAEKIIELDIANLIILGDEKDICSHGYKLDEAQIINPASSELRAELAEQLYEIRKAKGMTLETANELKNEGASFGDKLRLGVIIDTPAAAICGDLLAAEVDFFIVDSDLLSAFTLAADRRDPAVSDVIKKNPEPVLRLIEDAARAIHSSGKGKRIGVSGDLAADTSFTERLISIGVDFLSVPPPDVLRIRERVRECPE